MAEKQKPLPLYDFKEPVFVRPPTGAEFKAMHDYHEKNKTNLTNTSYVALVACNAAGERIYNQEDEAKIDAEWTMRDIHIAAAIGSKACGLDDETDERIKNA